MICKIIREPAGGGGVVNLGRYLVGAEIGRDPASWDRLSSYILGVENERGEIVADVRTTNCQSAEIGMAIKEMAIANARNGTSTAPKTYHIVLSLPPGETLTPDQFEEAEQRVIDKLGLQDCMRVSATHCSKEHLHRHIAVATASGPDAKNIRPKHDYAKVAAVTMELERDFGLSATNHQSGTGRAAVGSLEEYAKERAKEIGTPQTWGELHAALAEHGLYIKPRGAGLTIGSIEQPKLHVRASRVSCDLSHKALTDRLGPYELDTEKREGQKHSAEYEAYVQFRRQARAEYKTLAQATRAGQKEKTDAIAAFYRKRIDDELKLHGPHEKYARRYNVGIIIQQREAAHAKRREVHRQQQKAQYDANRTPAFEQWKERTR